MKSQSYLGSLHIASDVEEAKIKRLTLKGATCIRRGALAQLFGPADLSEDFQKIAFRGDLWHGPTRDTTQLHLDAQYIVKMLVPLLQEAVHDTRDPMIMLNGLRQIGHGTSLQVIDRYHNTKLDIHVSTSGWDRETWVVWRLTHWTAEGREIFKEKAVPYPEVREFDEEKERMKVVKAILSACKDWLERQPEL